MKKIYEKPIIVVESIMTDEIMGALDTQENILSYNTGWDGYTDSTYGFIKFETGDANVITGIDYSTFNQ